jgi:hypothetical protein
MRPLKYGLTYRCIAILVFVAVLVQSPVATADGLPLERQAFPSRPLILVQTFDPEHCKALCKRTYNFCLHLVDELANGPLRGDADLQQLQRDHCETNYENCARNCLR